MEQFSTEEYFSLSRALELHHAVFYTMWSLGRPMFVEDTDTAYIRFDERGESIIFGINKKFWDSCSQRKKEFIICHECMHVILHHGFRSLNLKNRLEYAIANQCMDIVVNHSLTNSFGFKREEIEGHEDLCWVDTVFPSEEKKETIELVDTDNKPIEIESTTTTPSKVFKNECFEYYYNMLKKEIPPNFGSTKILEDHSGMGSGMPGQSDGESKYRGDKKSDSGGGIPDNNEDQTESGMNAIQGKLSDKLTDEEKETLSESVGQAAGTEAGNLVLLAAKVPVVKKRKWETVIRRWANKFIKQGFKDHEQWARTNRRFVLVDKQLIIPTEMEIDSSEEDKKRIKVYFFLDTSGSCIGLKDRFWKAAMSLPEKTFDMELYCFDTRVYKVNAQDRKLYGFGGTSFSILENYIRADMIKRKTQYPKAVFVITDGYGDHIHPQYPERWHWFLTTGCKDCLPQTCNTYNLRDFE